MAGQVSEGAAPDGAMLQRALAALDGDARDKGDQGDDGDEGYGGQQGDGGGDGDLGTDGNEDAEGRGTDDRLMDLAERFLLARLPPRDEQVLVLQAIVQAIMTDREIARVDDLVRRSASTNAPCSGSSANISERARSG